ncbi:epidermal growth factor receptor substrate 15-like 1 isoform X2 [Hyalella azteca]|uniref:Epidermal growth factor receptor substrate 15-like 1 isoform X2 n=1 Tax=Hyalella azteca TaxID=294128 RepID=A0A8B7NF37_HYAAZ|nr:epidermal growth factor receptor substrate 15-like 1 isoform X2 [Hyalella azteca]
MASLPSPSQVAGEHIRPFETWYRRLDPAGTGIIQAGPAAQFLKKSGLDDDSLSKIWDLSDPNGKGYLDRIGLFVSLKLIALAQNKREVSLSNLMMALPPPNMGDAPPHPPPPHPPSHPPPPATVTPPNPALWTITAADRARYDQIFSSLGPSANKIHGNKVRGVMMNSKLPTDVLGKIWDLSDMDRDGSLDRAEFSIAMHLIYKCLENHPLPVGGLPPEMISSARRALGGTGPVPAPLAPPAPVQPQQTTLVTGPPKAPWVVSAADRTRYDVMFQNADVDKDGFVSGHEIKGIFLQSGLPQMVLAHIWNICDMKQTGKLTSEQFALAMWLIQQKLAGNDPPPQLTSEMIPPSMRPDQNQPSNVLAAKPQYSNPELQAVADEIDQVNADKLKLECEIQQKEATLRLKNNEIKNLQTELETLSATFKQLEHQKEVAQKRLDDLAVQERATAEELRHLNSQVAALEEEVAKLRVQVEEQEASLLEQEEEVLGKKRQLDDLRKEETTLEQSIADINKKLERLGNCYLKTNDQVIQLREKVDGIAEVELQLTETLNKYEAAIHASDASALSETCLMDPRPAFCTDPLYDHTDPTPTTSPTPPPQESPVRTQPQQNGIAGPQHNDVTATSKAKDTSFVGGHDPFASAFGGNTGHNDPFSSWDQKNSTQPAPSPAPNDPFGGDAFSNSQTGDLKSENNLAVHSGPPPRPESPSPALPPKKGKQPPPRPAPPKKGPAHPPPPKMASSAINSNNNPTDDAWGDSAKVNDTGDGFADFAAFADFDSKFSRGRADGFASAFDSGSKSTRPAFKTTFEDDFSAPWSSKQSAAALEELAFDSGKSSEKINGNRDPFETSHWSNGSTDSKSASGSSPWLDDYPSRDERSKFSSLSSASFASKDAFFDNFGSSNQVFNTSSSVKNNASLTAKSNGAGANAFSDANFGAGFGGSGDSDLGAITPSEDPFGVVDPFKDVTINEDDKFSWDDEPDPFVTDGGFEGGHASSHELVGKEDPFSVSFDANKNVIESETENKKSITRDPIDVSKLFSGLSLGVADTSYGGRSKSVLDDPVANVFAKQQNLPVRSKTALAEPFIDLNSFDPLAPSGSSPKKNTWISNEDLINENFGSSSSLRKSKGDSFGLSSTASNFNFNPVITASKLDFNNAFSDQLDFNNSFGSNITQKRMYTDLSSAADRSSVTSSQAFESKSSSPFPSSSGATFSSNSARSSGGALSESEQLSWAARESLRLEEENKRREEQENSDLQRAIALSAASAPKTLSS